VKLSLPARIVIAAVLTALVAIPTCRRIRRPKKPAPKQEDDRLILVTGYCDCGICCGWTRRWFGLGAPVYNYGKMKGKRKRVGITASGTRTRHGTLAADPKLFAFGTRLSIPGYGTGTVEDVGGSIKGRHIDAWFPSHEDARRWGARKLLLEELPPADNGRKSRGKNQRDFLSSSTSSKKSSG